MKYIKSEQNLAIPSDVTIQIKARFVTVTGPRGSLTKDLKHINVTFSKIDKNLIKIVIHNGDRKHVAALRTVKSLIHNMILGVTQGFEYKLRYVYAHFPINVNTIDKEDGKFVEIRNFLGDKNVRLVSVREGVEVSYSSNQKDEITLTGNSVDDVSQTAADIQQICRVRNKDIRKFLDGIYVSKKGVIATE